MANFDIALSQTLVFEGAYSNDGTDTGGETYCGVSRVHNPDWEGWEIIDNSGVPPTEHNREKLMRHVGIFYKKIWDRFDLDHQKQDVAEEMFDIAVNMGNGRAVLFLQQALNALNRDERLWEDLAVDGGYGPKTRTTFDKAYEDHKMLTKILVILRGAFYLRIVKRDTTQEKFIRGWLNRVQIMVRHQDI